MKSYFLNLISVLTCTGSLPAVYKLLPGLCGKTRYFKPSWRSFTWLVESNPTTDQHELRPGDSEPH